MITLKNLIETTLYEKRDSIKVFYDIDVFMQQFDGGKDEIEDNETLPQNQEVGAEENSSEEETQEESYLQKKYRILNEEIYKKKKKGVLEIDQSEAEVILTLNDLVDFLTDKKVGGKPVLSKFIAELLLVITNASSGVDKTVEDIISDGDKIKIILDYGLTKTNSIGFTLSKRAGSTAVSLLLRKNGENVQGAFNLQIFENYLLFYSKN